ncbi:MAG: acetyl-CoA carboxylase carboxyltransferase subunit alpha [Chloroflexota bacterium]|nr:acetyl-CoA carboxylase carboxyltransferase subunit alpha [Chloroflexota bacterium]
MTTTTTTSSVAGLTTALALVGRPRGQPGRCWTQCENETCRRLLIADADASRLRVCPYCQHHRYISARERLAQVLDPGSFAECDAELTAPDPLEFIAAGETYPDKVRRAQQRTREPEAAIGGSARIGGQPVEIVVLDFRFMGGTLGCVVGEKVARAAERALANHSALVTINASGGARMHEGLLALMQLGKTVVSLSWLAAAGVPHISVLANPTLGGVTASYAGLGDVLIAERGALVGFAGPRVVEQITREPLPPDAQRASFLLQHGMADMVVERVALRPMLIALVRLYAARRPSGERTLPNLPRAPETGHRSGNEPNPWERVQLARHRARPTTLDYAQLAFDSFLELHGDRLFADDPAIVGGLASLQGRTVILIGHQRGRSTHEAALRHFGMPRPEGYRKALRLMRQAERFRLPVVTLVDTPGADPSLEAEQRGQALAIANNLLAMCELRVPLVSLICGEGGSGGALALALADRVLMLENSVYSVASPEAAATILWRDATRGPEAAEAMKITAQDAARLGVVDSIVAEPAGGAHMDPAATALAVRQALIAQLDDLAQLSPHELLHNRMARYRHIDRSRVTGV